MNENDCSFCHLRYGSDQIYQKYFKYYQTLFQKSSESIKMSCRACLCRQAGGVEARLTKSGRHVSQISPFDGVYPDGGGFSVTSTFVIFEIASKYVLRSRQYLESFRVINLLRSDLRPDK